MSGTELPRTPSFRLDGKRALVTGAGRGIGLAAAAALAGAGAHVPLVARTPDEIESAAARICAEGGSAESWRLDVTGRQLFSPAGALVPLRAAEFDLLVALAERPQRVLNRDQLLDLSRGRAANSFDRSVDVQISRLRRKLKLDAESPELIKTVRGGGYVFSASVTAVGSDA